jgi:hypothetical protein
VTARSTSIHTYILKQIAQNKKAVITTIADRFSISRQAAHRHVRGMVDKGLLRAVGNTRSRKYELVLLDSFRKDFPISADLEEHAVWDKEISPKLKDLPGNVHDICFYGFTEMLNNVVDHSEGSNVVCGLELTAGSIELIVTDDGVGIFNKIARELKLQDTREAILELSKGKLTTDPRRHTGEGVFFTSRIFDQFSILSGNLSFMHNRDNDDWLLERDRTVWNGTAISMKLLTHAEQTLEQLFKDFSGNTEEGFGRTHVPLALARYGHENLISRSQAKRVHMRFERFREVLLDFEGVQMIGQGFADEIFRVFAQRNPKIKLITVNETAAVKRMIRHVLAETDTQRSNESTDSPTA